jgi:hypothetical protein
MVNYKRHDLFVDTNTNDNINVNNNENISRNRVNNNNTFKDFISSIIKMHTITPRAIRINMIVLTIVLTMPQLFFDWLNIHDTNTNTNINNLSDTYLLVAIVQKQTFSFIICYYIIVEDLHNIYQFPNINNYMTILCKIDTHWCKYYSILGLMIVSYYWFINRWIDSTNTYILFISILKLAILKYINKKGKK